MSICCFVWSRAFLRLDSRMMRSAVISAGLTPPTLLACPIVCGLTCTNPHFNQLKSSVQNLPSLLIPHQCCYLQYYVACISINEQRSESQTNGNCIPWKVSPALHVTTYSWQDSLGPQEVVCAADEPSTISDRKKQIKMRHEKQIIK